MYSLGFNNLSDSPVIVISPHQHQYDPITRAAHSWYHPHDNKKPNMSDFQRGWDDKIRDRPQVTPIRPSQTKKRREMEDSGVIDPAALGSSITQAGTPAGTPPDGPSGQGERLDTGRLVSEASKSLENLQSAFPAPNSEQVTAEQYMNERDHADEETNHRRKVSRQSSHHSAASDKSRGLFDMTPISSMTRNTSSNTMSDLAPIQQQKIVIDEWSAAIGMSWITPKDDSDHGSNAMILSHDWKLTNAHIRAVNKNTSDCLVELANGWYLFSDSMKQGRAVARTKDQAVIHMRAVPPVFAGNPVQLKDYDEISPKTSLAHMLEMSMPNETEYLGATAEQAMKQGSNSAFQQNLMENVRPGAADSGCYAMHDGDTNAMDID